jgi:hypothetical protein
MRRSVGSFLVALITCCVGLPGVLFPAPAAAATKRFEDRRADAPARHDLRRIAIGNTPDGVTLRVKVRDLRGGKRTQVTALLLAADGAEFDARTVRRGNGTVVTRLTRYDGGPPDPVHCQKSSRWRPGADVITMRLDQDCLADDPGLIVASVAMGWGAGLSGDSADFSRVVVVRYG